MKFSDIEKLKGQIVSTKQSRVYNDYKEVQPEGIVRLSVAHQDILKTGYPKINKKENQKTKQQEMKNKIDDKIDAGQDDYSQEFIQLDDYGLNQVQVKQKFYQNKKVEQQVVDIRTSQKVIETCTSEEDQGQKDQSDSNSNANIEDDQ